MREKYAQTVVTFRITYVDLYFCVCVWFDIGDRRAKDLNWTVADVSQI